MRARGASRDLHCVRPVSATEGRPRTLARDAALTLGALGIVYGDIGTSPLYAMRESFLAGDGIPVSEANVLGVLSLICWSLTLVITIKYLVFVMRADNHGEGGILALLALLHQYSGRVRVLAVALGIFGTALIYGDGMITPAISVLSAVEGFEVAAPGLAPFVIPLAVLILIGLFVVQSRGTGAIGRVFGPVMVVWFALLAGLGIAGIAQEPSVLRALLPSYAVAFFVDNGARGFITLGSVFLVVTGSEALYADMGHFGRRPIAIGWFALVFPALLLNYAGQAATLIGDPTTVENPFYRMAPEWGRFTLAVVATMATVIASQALISGAFSLTVQAIQLDFAPRTRIRHTSAREVGQVYVPAVNWALMVACVGLVIAFKSSGRLAAAYGVAVTTTMVITTVLFYLVATRRWRWRRGIALPLAGAFLVVDGAFFAANLFKIPSGGWFPLFVGVLLFTLMTTWRRGRELVAERLRGGAVPLDTFLESIRRDPPPRVPGTMIFLHRRPLAVPPALLAMLRTTHALAAQIVMVAVVTDDEAALVPPAGRADVTDLGDGFWQVTLRYGFFEQPDVPLALGNIVSGAFGFAPDAVTYVLGIERVVPTPREGMAAWREAVFATLSRNAEPAALYFGLPAERVIEVGMQVEL